MLQLLVIFCPQMSSLQNIQLNLFKYLEFYCYIATEIELIILKHNTNQICYQLVPQSKH